MPLIVGAIPKRNRRDSGKGKSAQISLGEIEKDDVARQLLGQMRFVVGVELRSTEERAKQDQRGAGAAQIAAHQTREGKLELSHEEMQRDRERAAHSRSCSSTSLQRDANWGCGQLQHR